MPPIRVLVIGCGNMGAGHARAYARDAGFELVGLVSRSHGSSAALARELGEVPTFTDVAVALATTRPDAVCVASYPDTHVAFARQAIEAGCHVFCEKPLAETVADASALIALARERQRALYVGYSLRVHPTWQRFAEIARTLGKPLVMRMNLNQRSSGRTWATHKALMAATPPIVDCGVHYVDMMAQMTGSRPIRVNAIGARLSSELKPGSYNYGQLQVVFADGSVGWYEAGWGPMMSENAYFVKDVIGPGGCVSIIGAKDVASDDVDQHGASDSLVLRRADPTGATPGTTEIVPLADEPGHQGICDREQALFLRAIRG
nr:Gfo/Idh/MocA family oxidoreductase [Planctomycetota bacterium]